APMLLVTGAHVPELVRKRAGGSPTVEDSSASRCEPKFEFGDRFVAATDPDDLSAVMPLRPDPRRPGSGELDYFDLDRPFQLLPDNAVTVRVQRAGPPSPVDITIKPEWGRTIGARMMMGPIVALRDDSPATKAGVQAREGKDGGDVLTAVEVRTADGT